MLRACDTAELITDLPLHHNKGLKEIYLGFCEASPNSENPAFPYGDYFVKYGGEGLNAFIDRVVITITGIVEHAEHDPVLIVAHGTVMRCFLTAIDPDHKDPGVPGNCAIAELKYEEGRFELEQLVVPGKD